MKKFTKGMLIAAGIFGAVGIGLTTAGGVMGASMTAMIMTTATTVMTVRIMPALLMRMRKMALYIS